MEDEHKNISRRKGESVVAVNLKRWEELAGVNDGHSQGSHTMLEYKIKGKKTAPIRLTILWENHRRSEVIKSKAQKFWSVFKIWKSLLPLDQAQLTL